MALSRVDLVKKKITKAFHKAIASYHLLEDGDKILLANAQSSMLENCAVVFVK